MLTTTALCISSFPPLPQACKDHSLLARTTAGQDSGWHQPAPASSSVRSPLPQPSQQRCPPPPGWRGAPHPQPQQHQQEPLHEPEWQAETSRRAPAAPRQQQQLEQGWEAAPLQQAPAVAATWQQKQTQGWEAEQVYPSQPVPAAEGGWGGDHFTSCPQAGSTEDRWGGEPQQGYQGSWAQQQQPAAAGQAEAGIGGQQPAPLHWQHQYRHESPAAGGWQAGTSAPQPGSGWQAQQGAQGRQAQEWGPTSGSPQPSRRGSSRPEVSHAAWGEP